MPQSSEVRVNPVTQVSRMRRRPKRLASHPDMGRMMALETRYEVTTQVPSSTVAPMLPAMCGTETLTTVVSRISMNVASMTASGHDPRINGVPGFGGIHDAIQPVIIETPGRRGSDAATQLPRGEDFVSRPEPLLAHPVIGVTGAGEVECYIECLCPLLIRSLYAPASAFLWKPLRSGSCARRAAT